MVAKLGVWTITALCEHKDSDLLRSQMKSAHANRLCVCIYSLHLAHCGRNAGYYIFSKANMLNRHCMLFCLFDRGNPQLHPVKSFVCLFVCMLYLVCTRFTPRLRSTTHKQLCLRIAWCALQQSESAQVLLLTWYQVAGCIKSIRGQCLSHRLGVWNPWLNLHCILQQNIPSTVCSITRKVINNWLLMSS